MCPLQIILSHLFWGVKTLYKTGPIKKQIFFFFLFHCLLPQCVVYHYNATGDWTKSSPFTNGLLFTANLIQSNTQCLAATKQLIHYLNTKQAGQWVHSLSGKNTDRNVWLNASQWLGRLFSTTYVDWMGWKLQTTSRKVHFPLWILQKYWNLCTSLCFNPGLQVCFAKRSINNSYYYILFSYFILKWFCQGGMMRIFFSLTDNLPSSLDNQIYLLDTDEITYNFIFLYFDKSSKPSLLAHLRARKANM